MAISNKMQYLVFILILFLPVELAANVHAFYYIWYGSPPTDGKYIHWNHAVLPHWEERINRMYSNIGVKYNPPEEIHSIYYPFKGLYSSRDTEIIKIHQKEMYEAGIDTIVVSWWGKEDESHTVDSQGVNTDKILHNLLIEFEDNPYNITIALHLEPYPGRTVQSIKSDIQYIHRKYGQYKSLYRTPDTNLLLFYVYDSYHILTQDWSRLLTMEGDLSIRNTANDGVFIGLWLHEYHGRDIKEGGFDGFYTYFSSHSFSFGSTMSNWKYMCDYAIKNNLTSIISIGPGYNDERIRPWNAHNTKDRRKGEYYKQSWSNAINANPKIVSITSWNEWGEGTQIEPAGNKQNKIYLNYDGNPYKYINITNEYAKKMKISLYSEAAIKEL